MNQAVTSAPIHSADTRRMHDRVRRYWESVKDNRPYPREDEIDASALQDVWTYCFLVDMRRGGVHRGFRYQYMGQAIIDAFGTNMAAIELCDAGTLPHVASMLRHFDEVRESGEMAIDESSFVNVRGTTIKYRSCLLPLGDSNVEHILGCMRWKEE